MKPTKMFLAILSFPMFANAYVMDCMKTSSIPRLEDWTVQVADRTVQQSGIASWYGPTGNPTASGEPFRPSELTAAHKNLPFGTRVKVTNTQNGRSVCVKINDRGPYVAGRVIDLTEAAKRALGMGGTAKVSLSNCDQRT